MAQHRREVKGLDGFSTSRPWDVPGTTVSSAWGTLR
jgi:hypothetical protein